MMLLLIADPSGLRNSATLTKPFLHFLQSIDTPTPCCCLNPHFSVNLAIMQIHGLLQRQQ
jgi:hypothetical protein